MTKRASPSIVVVQLQSFKRKLDSVSDASKWENMKEMNLNNFHRRLAIISSTSDTFDVRFCNAVDRTHTLFYEVK